jgi:hypothetical protein
MKKAEFGVKWDDNLRKLRVCEELRATFRIN